MKLSANFDAFLLESQDLDDLISPQLPNQIQYAFYSKAFQEELEAPSTTAFTLPENNNEDEMYKQALNHMKPSVFPLELEKTYNLNSVFYDSRLYQDPFPFLSVRKRIRLYVKLLSFFSFKIISFRPFKAFCSFMILLNTALLMTGEATIFGQKAFFSFFYLETILKLLGMGFFSQGKGFFCSGYNILDFLINVSFIFTSFSNDLNYMDFSAFRTLRLVAIIPSMRLHHILQSIISSVIWLAEILVLLLSFLVCCSLIGLHLFYGLLKNRCLVLETGLPNANASFCGNFNCNTGEFCGKVPFNPDLDLTSFDDMFHSLLQVFRFFTLSDWTTCMYLLQRTYSNFIWIYPLGVIFFGNYFLLNLMFAILKVKFTENQHSFKEQILTKEESRNPRFDFKQMVNEKLFRPHQNQSDKLPKERSDKRYKTSLNAKVAPRSSSKRSFGSPQYLNTSLKVVDTTADEVRMFDGIFKYYEKLKENIKNFSRTRLSESTDMQNHRINYLEVRVRNELEYQSTSEEDVTFCREAPVPTRDQKKGSFIRANLDFKRDIERIRKKWENAKFNFSGTSEQKAQIQTKRSIVSPTLAKMKKSIFYTTKITTARLTTTNVNGGGSVVKTRRSRGEGATSPGVRVFRGRKERSKDKGPVLASKFHLNEIIRKKIMEPLIKEDDEYASQNIILGLDYEAILKQDKRMKRKENHIWSGEEVLPRRQFQGKKLLTTLKALSRIKKNIWQISFKGYIGFVKSLARSVCHSKPFFLLHCLAICVQTVDLALQGNIDDSQIDLIFDLCSLYNCAEIMLKFLGFGFHRIFRDKLLSIDVLSFMYFLIKMMLGYMNMDSSYLRFFKTVVLLRNIRLFSLISYMKTILYVIRHTWFSILNLALVLILMLFTFALFGMQLFGQKLHSLSGTRFIFFDSLAQGYLSVFDLITFDNWYTLLLDGVNNGFTFSMALFIFSSIIIGSYVLLNLFLAIVLEGFEFVSTSVEKKPKGDLKTIFLSNLVKIAPKTINIANIQSAIMSLKDQDSQSPRSPRKQQPKALAKMSRFSSFADQIIRVGVRKFAMIMKEGDRSLGIFSRSSVIRRFCTRLASHNGFKMFLFGLYLLNAILMAYETFYPHISCYHGVVNPSNTPDLSEKVSEFQFIALMSINFGWSLEILVKVIRDGFLLNEHAFIKSPLNFFDFITVLIHFLDCLMTFPWVYQYIGFLRLLKTFRLLRNNSYIPLLFQTLLDSLDKFLNVLLVVLLAWLIFGILGIILFRGRLGHCIVGQTILDSLDINFNQCLIDGNSWTTSILNFENFHSAILTLLGTASYDNWFDILQPCVNADNPEKVLFFVYYIWMLIGPSKFNNLASTFLFFIGFITIGTWFFVGLLNGVIFSIFFKAQKQQLHKFLDDDQVKWLEITKFILKTQPNPYFIPNKGPIFRLYSLKKSKLFSTVKLLILIMNSVVLCLFSDRNSHDYYINYRVFYLIATCFYILELMLNIRIYKFTNYLGKHMWHNILALICIIYLSNSIVMFFPNLQIIGRQSSLFRFFRFLLSVSIIRLIKRFKSLKKLVSFLYFSFPMIANLIFLLFIIFFVYAILGCRWFGLFRGGQQLDDYLNFKDFFYSLMTIFRTATANNWTSLMLDVVQHESDQDQRKKVRDYLFFVTFMLITFFFLINLFTLTLTKEFEDFYVNINSPLQLYKDNLKRFQRVWSTFCMKESLMVIPVDVLTKFFRNLGSPLGCDKYESDLEIGKKLMNLQLRDEGKGMVYFNELLFVTMRLFFRDIIKKNENPQAMLELKRNEQHAFQLLEKQKNMMEFFNSSQKLHGKGRAIIRRGQRMNEKEMEEFLTVSTMKKKYINPLYRYFFNVILLKTWRRYTIEKLQKFEHFESEENED